LCILNGRNICTLHGFLEMVNTDPLDNPEFLRSNTEYHTRLAKLYRQLSRTCLVGRANEPGLRSHEHIHQINLSSIPAHINSDDVLSDLRYLGLQKTEQVIAWLRRFLAQNPGKVLIFAHHNDVVEEVAAALYLPAIYGMATDEDQRRSIAACFIHPEGSQALIVASDVELAYIWRRSAHWFSWNCGSRPGSCMALWIISWVRMKSAPCRCTCCMSKIPWMMML